MKILVVVDPASPTHRDVDLAVKVALRESARIDLFACDDEPGVPQDWVGSINVREYRGILRERTLQRLEEIARPIRTQGLVVTTACLWHASRAEGIYRHILQSDADLLAYGGSLIAYAESHSIMQKRASEPPSEQTLRD